MASYVGMNGSEFATTKSVTLQKYQISFKIKIRDEHYADHTYDYMCASSV